MPIILNDGYLLEGDASVADKIDYTVSGLDGTTLKMLASGQLDDNKATLYTASGVDIIRSITLFNTHNISVIVNLYINDGSSRQVVGAELGAGYHAQFDGDKLTVEDENGNQEVNQNALPHGSTHENGGDDEISVTGLSGLLADDQHVLDSEITAVAVAKALYTAYTILMATTNATPEAIAIAEQQIIGRITGGAIKGLSVAEVLTLLGTLPSIDEDNMASNLDTKVPTQQSVKAYVDAIIAAADALVYKGAIDCSGNPNYPAADCGHVYKVSVAGKIGGSSGLNVEVGDTLLCIHDATASGNQATVGTYWNVIQVNLDGAIIGPASAVDSNFAGFDGTGGKLIKDSGSKSSDFAISGHTHGQLHTQGTDTALGTLDTKNPPIDADLVTQRDSVSSFALFTSTWTQIKAFLKTYFDTLYNLYVHPNHSGDVTSVADGATTIANNAVTLAKLATQATDTFLANATAGAAVPTAVAVAAQRVVGRITDGHITDLTSAQVQTLLAETIDIVFVIDGGGSAITTGEKGHLEIPFACTLTAWTLMADVAGAIVIDIWKDSYANFPPTNADAMPGSGKEPTIVATNQKAQDTDISDWTTVAIAAGNILAFNVDSCTTITRVVLSLKATRV